MAVYGPAPPPGSKVVGGVTKVPKKFVGPVRPGTDVERFRRTGVSAPRVAPVVGPTRADLEAEQKRKAQEQKLIEQMREAGRKESAKRTQQALRGQPLVKSLRAREQIKLKAQERGRPFTQKEIGAELIKRGTSIQELRQATKSAREQFRKTGVSVTEQIRLEEESKKAEVVTVKEVRPSKDVFGPVQITQTERDRLAKEREKFSIFETIKEKVFKKEAIAIKELKKRQPKTITELTQVPIKTVGLLGEAVGGLFPEEGITKVKIKETPAREITYGVPGVTPITAIKLKKQPEKEIRILTPEQVKAGVEIGVVIAAPLVFAPGFVTSGAEAALDKEKTEKERILGGAEALLGTTIIGTKAVRYLRSPVTTTKPLRPIKEPEAFEVTKIKTIKEKPTPFTVFEIRGEVRPPTVITETTKGRQIIDFFGKQAEKVVQVGKEPMVPMRAPPKVTEIPARPFTIRTPEPVIGEQPFVVSEVIKGRRFATISRIEGVSKKISLEDFKRLSKQEQRLLQLRAEELTGRKVPLKQVPIILSKETERAVSLTRAQELARVTPRKTFTEIKSIPGKRRPTLQLGVTDVERKIKLDTGELIKARTLLGDITFERVRPIRKAKELDTTILKLKPKPEDKVKFIRPSKIKKTPLSKTFQEQVIEPKAARVPLPKPDIIKPVVIKELKPSVAERIIPPTVIGTRADSVFARTGQYEITTPQVARITIPSIIEKPQVQVPRQIELLISKQPQVQIGKTKPAQIELFKSIEVQKSAEAIKQIEAQKTLQRQIQLQRQLLKLKPTQALKFGEPLIKPQRKPTPTKLLPPKITPAKKALKVVEKAMKKEFEVFARVEGQDISIGKAKTKKEATKKLSKRLKGTIAASGFIEEDGRRLSVQETGLVNGEFRKSFIDMGRVVQKKRARLGTAQEVSELAFFKKTKGGGGNLFGSSSRRRSNSGFSFI